MVGTMGNPMEAQTLPAKSLKRAIYLFRQDLEALPEDAFDKDFGPVTRTVADIVFEVNMVNDHVGMVIRNEKPFDWPDGAWIKAPEDFRSKDVVIAAFEASTQKVLATVCALTDQELDAKFLTDEGETDRAERCRFMTLHLWYHSGQLNFIQTLIGDDGWHWK